jgi:hypothetical protein
MQSLGTRKPGTSGADPHHPYLCVTAPRLQTLFGHELIAIDLIIARVDIDRQERKQTSTH